MNMLRRKNSGTGNTGKSGAPGRAMGRLAKSIALFLSFAGLLLGATNASAVACTAIASSAWNVQTTWGAAGTGCAGAPGGIPGAADTVTVPTTFVVTVTAAAAATSLTVNGTGSVVNNSTLTISGVLGGTGGLTNSATGILSIGGNATITTLTATAVGNTVNYTGAAQTAKVTTYSNLTLSGSGAKTFATTPTVNGVLSLEGTATVVATTGVVTYGANATLQYNTATARTTTLEEWPATYAATGGVIIKNTGIITLNANKVLSNGVPLTIDLGATLTTAARTLNVGGDLTVNGTLTGTSGAITLSGTAPRTIDGTGSIIATTTGTLSITTSRTILNTANLTIGRPATLSAATTVTNNGIINKTTTAALTGANATTSIWVNAAGSTLNYAGTTAPMATGVLTASAVGNTVNYNGAAQTVEATPYFNLGLGGSGVKTLTGVNTIAGNLDISGTASATAAAALTVGGNFSNAATFANGANALNVAGDFNQSGTFTAGAGIVTLNGGAAVQTISGTGPLGFANLTVSNAGITLARNVTVTSAIIGTVTLTRICPDYTLTSNGGATVAHSCPAVVSINRADASPTNAASVSWAVVFNTSVTGVSSGNFALVNVGLGGAPAITGVSGSGTTWTVTASTGTGDGTLGLNMVDTTGVSPAIDSLPFTGQEYTLDRTAPVVSSIVRANPNPTSQASVSWTVTFSENVTGVDTTDFVLVKGGGVSVATITLTGGGTSWTVTANTVSGQGTLGLNLVDDDTIVDAAGNPLGGAGAGNGNFTGEYYDIVSATVITHSPTACTNVAGIGTVTWNTATPNDPLASDNLYATAAVDGTITNFLQCTGYGFAIPAGATINGITVNVERKSSSIASGGSQDAATRLVRDAAGVAAIQATDRSTATIYTAADFIEAHGGAADLWGTTWTAADINNANFGAAFAATKASGAGGAHTVSVDHMSIGISYSALPDHYELSLPASGITCLPVTVTVKACADNSSPCTNTYAAVNGTTATLAAGAGTLASTMVVFNASGVASTTLSYPTAADAATASVTLSGEGVAATNPRQCCPDGASCAVANSCSTTFNTAGFIISGSAGGMEATIPAQVAGQSSATYYLRAIKSNTKATTATQACEAALTGAGTVNFAYECNNPTSCYAADLMSVNGGTATTIARNNNGSVSSYTPVNMTFDANGNAPFTFNYSDVGQVTLHARKAADVTLLSALTGSSNAFVVKPGGFALSGILPTLNPVGRCAVNPNSVPACAADATGAKFVKAGEAFSATVTATTIDGVTATPSYGQETAQESVKLTSALVAGLGLTNNPAIGGTFGTFVGGVATGAFTWNEVGIIKLTPSVGDGDYLGAGEVTGTASGNVGRFYAAQFTLAPSPIANRTGLAGCAAPAGCGAFTYMGEQMSALFTLTAQAVDGTRLQNYVDAFAKLDPTAAGALNIGAIDNPPVPATRTPLGARISTAGLPAATGMFLSTCTPSPDCFGTSVVTAPFMISRGAAADGPYAVLDVGVAPVDSDGAALTYNLDTVNVVAGTLNHTWVGRTEARYGRMKLSNAHGSELLNLPIAMEAQYWQGQFWAQNNLDDATAIIQNNIKLATTSGPAATISSVVRDAAGRWRIVLNRQTAPGSTRVCVDLDVGATGDMTCVAAMPLSMPYLQTGAAFDQDPVSRATFGVYKGNNEFIYLREAY